MLFAINIFFTQRVIRAIHPKFGWHPAVNNAFWGVIISVPLIIFWNIIVASVGAFVKSPKALLTVRGLSLFGSAWTTSLSLFPIIFVPIAVVIPSPTPIEKFGVGRFRWKIVIVIWASAMLFVGAVTRAIANAQVHPKNDPGQVDSRVAFYTTGFMLEILVVFVFAVARIDLLFHVPDGCTGPGDYIKRKEDDEEELFQDVDVKMRMSMESADAQRMADGVRWQKAAPDRRSATREQVKQAIDQLKLNAELVSRPIGAGEEELLVYAFRVKKEFGGQITRPNNEAPKDCFMGEEGTRWKRLEDKQALGDLSVMKVLNSVFGVWISRRGRPVYEAHEEFSLICNIFRHVQYQILVLKAIIQCQNFLSALVNLPSSKVDLLI